jgi:enoyl-CoA hydratase/carnithine racemase
MAPMSAPANDTDERHARYAPAGANGIGALRFTRPEKLNATDDATVDHLATAVEAAWADDPRALVVAGEGRAFCAGIDLRALANDAIPESWFRRWEEALARLEALPATAIAAIQGPCLGGGLQVALCCDLCIAAEDATFGLSALTHGIIPGLATFRLAARVGEGAAREMMLLGDTWDAARALRQGLVERVVPNDELETVVRAVAERIAASPSEAVRATKALTRAARDVQLETFIDLYVDAQRRCRDHPETRAKLEVYAREHWSRR